MTDAVVHIVDDDVALCEALDRQFRSVGLATRCHQSVQSFLDTPRDDTPSCLVLDVRLPGMSGLEFQANLERYQIRLPVILMTGFGDVPMSVRAMKAGAIDFLLKPFRDQDLLDAVGSAIDKDRARRQTEKSDADVQSRYARLTQREREVCDLVVAGNMNKQIAARLGLSEVTIKAHRGAMMRKLGVRTVADLVRLTF